LVALTTDSTRSHPDDEALLAEGKAAADEYVAEADVGTEETEVEEGSARSIVVLAATGA